MVRRRPWMTGAILGYVEGNVSGVFGVLHSDWWLADRQLAQHVQVISLQKAGYMRAISIRSLGTRLVSDSAAPRRLTE